METRERKIERLCGVYYYMVARPRFFSPLVLSRLITRDSFVLLDGHHVSWVELLIISNLQSIKHQCRHRYYCYRCKQHTYTHHLQITEDRRKEAAQKQNKT